jgi:hypothetical protein
MLHGMATYTWNRRKIMRISFYGLIGLVGALLVSPGLVNADVLFTQATDLASQVQSQNDTSLGGSVISQIYDNFTLGANSSVENIQWTGGYGGALAANTLEGFTISLWAFVGPGAAGSGTLIDSQTITAAAANETAAGSDFLGPVYTYSADISPLLLASGQQYWLSIVANLPTVDGSNPNWNWESSNNAGVGAISYQDFSGSFRSSNNTDLAFTLNGQPYSGPLVGVPEPGSVMLLGIGFCGFAGVAALKRRKA